MSTAGSRIAVTERFLEALRGRDYDGLAACLAPDATMRSVVPPGIREDDGAEAIVQRFRLWTEAIDGYAVEESDAAEFAGLVRLRWVVSGSDPTADVAPSTFEQSAYADVEDGRIARLRLACSGHRPLP